MEEVAVVMLLTKSELEMIYNRLSWAESESPYPDEKCEQVMKRVKEELDDLIQWEKEGRARG